MADNADAPQMDPPIAVDRLEGSRVDSPSVVDNTEAPHVDQESSMEVPLSVTHRTPRRATAPKARPAARLPNGAHDLVAAVIGPLKLQTTALQWAAIERLDNEFVCKMKNWAVLWPSRSSNRNIIPTFIDIELDPIVHQLTEWLRDTNPDAPPPLYPAVCVIDPRPEETVPPELRAMDTDVWPLLQRAGLDRVCDVFSYYYTQGRLTEKEEPVPSTLAPCNERLRQWKRLTASGEVAFKDVVECLGWHDISRDSGIVHCITEALLSHEKILPAVWSTKRGSTNMWKCSVCFPMMRAASTYVAQSRRGGAAMDKVWRALRQY